MIRSKQPKKSGGFYPGLSEEIKKLTIVDFANKAGCSEATVVRLAKRLGYDGFLNSRMISLAMGQTAMILSMKAFRAATITAQLSEKCLTLRSRPSKIPLILWICKRMKKPPMRC